jgi:hypothetical protein
MNKSILKQTFLLLSLVVIFDSCMTDDLFSPKERLSPEGVEAQTWYNKQGNSEGIRLVSPNGQKRNPILPDWNVLFSQENEEYKVTEVNLKPVRKKFPANAKGEVMESEERFLIATPECMEKSKETGDRRYLAFNIRLIIRTDKKTNQKDGFVMMVSPDLSYVETRLDNPLKDFSYLERDKEFSGFVQYYDLEGNFVNAWRYRDGTAHVLRPRVGEPPGQTN